MIHLPDIWDCLENTLTRGTWFSLDEIYKHIEDRLNLDEEDFEPQAPGSSIPKWKRNVRNVLQYRKKTREIEWDGDAQYRIR